jgi:hypothetical protein
MGEGEVYICTVHFPPIDAIRVAFAEEVGAAGGQVAHTYDVGGELYAWAAFSHHEGKFQSGVALRVTDVEVEVRPVVTWGNGELRLIAGGVGGLAFLGDRDPVRIVREGVRACAPPSVFQEILQQRESARSRVVEHPGSVVLALISALAQVGAESEKLLGFVPGITSRIEGVAPVTEWTAVEAVALVAADVDEERARWQLAVLAGVLLARASGSRGVWGR